MIENCHENVEDVENVEGVENVGDVENIENIENVEDVENAEDVENVMMTWKSSLCESCLFVGSVLRRKMMMVTKIFEIRLEIGSVQRE